MTSLIQAVHQCAEALDALKEAMSALRMHVSFQFEPGQTQILTNQIIGLKGAANAYWCGFGSATKDVPSTTDREG